MTKSKFGIKLEPKGIKSGIFNFSGKKLESIVTFTLIIKG